MSFSGNYKSSVVANYAERGLDLEKTLLAQQKTIEELVLYVIKLNKEIEALKK